jgi:hypothetical protein
LDVSVWFNLKSILHQQLARRGYLVNRAEPAVPPSITAYLRTFQRRFTSPVSLVCFDNGVRIQSEILGLFPSDRVLFSFPLFLPDSDEPAPGTVLPSIPSSQFIAIVDIAAFPIEELLAHLPWLVQAEALLLRSRLGSFWSGEVDLHHLIAVVVKQGFHFVDVVDTSFAFALQAQSARPVFAFERGHEAGRQSNFQRYRTNEAVAYLSAPVVKRGDFRPLAGRGSFGFAAGVLNPGAIIEAGRIHLLCRTERTPWASAKKDESLFFAQSPPLLLNLDADDRVESAAVLAIENTPGSGGNRAEDFRLFRFRGETFSNHVVISDQRERTPGRKALRLDSLKTRLGISRLRIAEKRLDWCGFPLVDRPLAQTEKNWSMFTDGDRLFLLYSFSPYVLLSASNWPSLEFATILEARPAMPFDGDGLSLRNSVNPVDYDDCHWLHIVHKVYPGKKYSFWATLIDKKTLLPVRVIPQPLVFGWPSNSASIIYACSVIVSETAVLLFAGTDDSGMAVASIPRERLDAEWVAVRS